jgi:hypothetical protein
MKRHRVLPVTLVLGSTLLVLAMASAGGPDRLARFGHGPWGSESGVRIEALGITLAGPSLPPTEERSGTGRAGEGNPGSKNGPTVPSARPDADPGATAGNENRTPRAVADRDPGEDARESRLKAAAGTAVRTAATVARAAVKVCVCVLERLLRLVIDRLPIDGFLEGFK